MKGKQKINQTIKVLFLVAVFLIFTDCENNSSSSATIQAKVDSFQNGLKSFRDEKAISETRLQNSIRLILTITVIRNGTCLPIIMPITSKTIIPAVPLAQDYIHSTLT